VKLVDAKSGKEVAEFKSDAGKTKPEEGLQEITP